MEKKNTLLLAMIILLLLGVWLRYSCSWFAYPLTVNWDEERLVGTIFGMFSRGSLNPEFFNYPSLVIYLNAFLFLLIGNVAKCLSLGTLATVDFFVAGRLLTVFIASLTMALVAYLAWRTFSPLTGLLSLLFITTSFMHVRYSAVVRVDPYVGLWSLCAFAAALAIYKGGPNVRYYIIGGLFVGLATSSKYTAFLACLPIVVAHLALYRNGKCTLFSQNIFFAGASSLLVFFITTPYAILDCERFLAALRFEANHYAVGHPGFQAAGATSFALYGKWLVAEGFGAIPCLVALLGLLCLAKEDSTLALLVVSFPSALFIFVGQHRVFFPRNIVGTVPFLAILAGFGMVQVYETIRSRTSEQRAQIILVLIALVVLSDTTSRSLSFREECNLPDTRWIAARWILDNLPEGSSIGREQYTPPIEGLTKRFKVYPLGLLGVGRHPQEAAKMDFLLVSSQDHLRVLRNPQRFPREAIVYNELFSRGRAVALFSAKSGEVSGPTISIYRLPSTKAVD